jgi:hypothetical protein
VPPLRVLKSFMAFMNFFIDFYLVISNKKGYKLVLYPFLTYEIFPICHMPQKIFHCSTNSILERLDLIVNQHR